MIIAAYTLIGFAVVWPGLPEDVISGFYDYIRNYDLTPNHEDELLPNHSFAIGIIFFSIMCSILLWPIILISLWRK